MTAHGAGESAVIPAQAGAQSLRVPSELARSLETRFLSKLEYLNAIGIALSQERDINRLLETILVAAKNLTRADGGTLYRAGRTASSQFEIVRTDSLSIAMGGSSGDRGAVLPDPARRQGRQAQLHDDRGVRGAHRTRR